MPQPLIVRLDLLRSCVLVGLAGFLARVIYVVLETKIGLISGAFFSGDAVLYDELARNLLSGAGMSHNGRPTAFVSPGYPLFLAGCYGMFGQNQMAVGIVQSMLNGLTCVWAFLIARYLVGSRAAWFAAAICILLPELIIWTSGQILTEPLYTFLLTSGIGLGLLAVSFIDPDQTSDSIDWRSLVLAAAAGCVIGLAALTRPLALALAALLCVYILVRTRWQRGLAMAIGVAIMIVPWGLRNQYQFGRFIVTSAEAGYVAYLYHRPHEISEYNGYNLMAPRLAAAAGLDEAGQDRVHARAAIEYALAHPRQEVIYTWYRFWNVWRPTYAVASPRNRWTARLTYVPFMALAVCGFFASKRTGSAGVDRAWGFLAVVVCFHLVFHGLIAAELRFRIPLEPVLAVYAAVTLNRLFAGCCSARLWQPPTQLPLGADSHTAHERLTIVVPALNEAGQIVEVLEKVHRLALPRQVIVVNDGSTDETAGLLDQHRHLYDERIDHAENQGKGSAIRSALKLASGDVVIVQDADGELDPSEIAQLAETLQRTGAAAVYGSRFIGERQPVPLVQRAANWLLTSFTNVLYKAELTDMETGFKVVRTDILRALRLSSRRYDIEPELTAKLLRGGHHIVEVPVRFNRKDKTQRAIGVRDGLQAIWVLMRIRCLGR